jgi:hypothetical protein
LEVVSLQLNPIPEAAPYSFGGAAWTFVVLNIQEHFFLPDDLTPQQLHRLEKAKWWITLFGTIGGLIVFGLTPDFP